MRGVSVHGILTPEKKSLCSSLRRNLRTSPGGWHIPHTFVFPLLSNFLSAWMHINGLMWQVKAVAIQTVWGHPDLKITAYASLLQQSCFQILYTCYPHFLSHSLGCVFYLKWKNWCISTLRFFFPSMHQHSCNSKGYTSNEGWILTLFAATSITVIKTLPSWALAGLLPPTGHPFHSHCSSLNSISYLQTQWRDRLFRNVCNNNHPFCRLFRVLSTLGSVLL